MARKCYFHAIFSYCQKFSLHSTHNTTGGRAGSGQSRRVCIDILLSPFCQHLQGQFLWLLSLPQSILQASQEWPHRHQKELMQHSQSLKHLWSSPERLWMAAVTGYFPPQEPNFVRTYARKLQMVCIITHLPLLLSHVQILSTKTTLGSLKYPDMLSRVLVG